MQTWGSGLNEQKVVKTKDEELFKRLSLIMKLEVKANLGEKISWIHCDISCDCRSVK